MRYEREGLTGAPTFYVSYTRHDCHERYPGGDIIGKVERQGTTMALVRDLRPPWLRP